jgi:predicted dinucleotide-binding enzyme
LPERLAIVGSGAIATGLAAAVAAAGDEPVTLCARSEASAERARARIATLCERFEPPVSHANVSVVASQAPPGDATFIIEAIAEHLDAKQQLLAELARLSGKDVILASTTSSLSIEQLAAASHVPDRFVGLHVFNPVTRMELVELVFPARATQDTRERARALCDALGKTAVDVPDLPSAPSSSSQRPASARRTSIRACASALVTRWDRWPFSTWSDSTCRSRSESGSASRCRSRSTSSSPPASSGARAARASTFTENGCAERKSFAGGLDKRERLGKY